MTTDESIAARAKLLKRVKDELTPDNCPFCGGMHIVRISRCGEPQFNNLCCSDMMREVHRIYREIFGMQG